MQLDELLDQFQTLSQRIAEAIVFDENISEIRHLDEQLSEIFNSVLAHETSSTVEHLKKFHFLIDQIVDSDDRNTRQQLADHLKIHKRSLDE